MTAESPNEPVLTRRARRASSEQLAAPAESVPLTRAERRRLAEAAAPAGRPAMPIAQTAPQEPEEVSVVAEAEQSVHPEASVAQNDAAISIGSAVAAETSVPRPVSTPGEGGLDAFECAARLFSFTGDVQIVRQPVRDEAEDAAEPAPEEPAGHVVPRRAGRRLSVRRIAASSFSVGVLGIVGLLAVGMTTAPQAVAAANNTTPTTSNLVLAGDVPAGGSNAIQAYVAPSTVQTVALDRSDYSTGSIAATAASLGITQTSNFFINNPDSPIQWPFAVGVPISYGFGWRTDVDTGTEFHEGADFTPGQGAHVQAIADGVIRIATEAGGAYGVTVVIDHKIDGQLISTRYAHMLYGSLQVTPGETVKVGQYLGRTGNTGQSFGAHTHVEVLINGTTPIDPIAWLRTHAGG